MKLSDESFTLFLLCSHLGLPDEPDAKPLSAREWNELERRLEVSSINIATLPGTSANHIESNLQIGHDEAARLAR
jgi:hypothetical protein